MEYILETQRLYLRKIEACDIDDLFEMDSDPEVHRYIENDPVKSKDQIAEVVEMLHRQYRENGIARWAVIDKETLKCVGWAGLKLFREPLNNHVGFHELGYRFKQKHWGKGLPRNLRKPYWSMDSGRSGWMWCMRLPIRRMRIP